MIEPTPLILVSCPSCHKKLALNGTMLPGTIGSDPSNASEASRIAGIVSSAYEVRAGRCIAASATASSGSRRSIGSAVVRSTGLTISSRRSRHFTLSELSSNSRRAVTFRRGIA